MKNQKTLMHHQLYFVRAFLAIVILLLSHICYGLAEAKSGDVKRNANWAVVLDKPGLPNLHKISDDLYRGAQPKAEGMLQLVEMGIKTVVNLRSSHSDLDELEGTELDYVEIPMMAWRPKEAHVVEFLQIMTDPERLPVFVHCLHGADRTGTLVAAYRVIIEGWTKDDAIEEMKKGGFGFHTVWQNLPRFVKKLDVERIQQELGLK